MNLSSVLKNSIYFLLVMTVLFFLSCADKDKQQDSKLEKQKKIETSNFYTINILFDNLSGLDVGNKILLDNNKIGEVSDLELIEDKVKVIAKIEKNVKIYENSEITIEKLKGSEELAIIVKLPTNDNLRKKVLIDDANITGKNLISQTEKIPEFIF
ncbi:MAG TPA: MlaD family protein [bacterium]|nr:MlaD family protein [bacterium]HPP86348.1 MlaD family protein [bacterium]